MSENYRLYVDGSAIGNVNVDANTPAGWGVVCVLSAKSGKGKAEGVAMSSPLLRM